MQLAKRAYAIRKVHKLVLWYAVRDHIGEDRTVTSG